MNYLLMAIFTMSCDWFVDAKKELQRQRGGVLMDLNQYNLSTAARHRRPGILGYHQYFSRFMM